MEVMATLLAGHGKGICMVVKSPAVLRTSQPSALLTGLGMPTSVHGRRGQQRKRSAAGTPGQHPLMT